MAFVGFRSSYFILFFYDIHTFFFFFLNERKPRSVAVAGNGPERRRQRPCGEGDAGRRWGTSVAFLPLRPALAVRLRAEPEPSGAAQNTEPRGRDVKRRARGSARRGPSDKSDAEMSARRRGLRNAALAARTAAAPGRLRGSESCARCYVSAPFEGSAALCCPCSRFFPNKQGRS